MQQPQYVIHQSLDCTSSEERERLAHFWLYEPMTTSMLCSGVTGGEAGGQSAPETSDQEISADLFFFFFFFAFHFSKQLKFVLCTGMEIFYWGSAIGIGDRVASTNHIIDWEDPKILHRESGKFTRWIRESIWIRRRGSKAMNNEGGITYNVNHVYNHIIQKSRNTSSGCTNLVLSCRYTVQHPKI